ncbi:hypothetical protein COU78_05755 [Candidatus Peregrinibacteria bacterium CG10_big_fil_rev_8_21_14_0_10_49_24]|nr:MAG: hypothetical protein COV83_03540 [Candidatus Peregrinibacteria bacterium CG11_big_fil_rev_8_21_14_0_20_49_14]PIR50631.1 MAG: hypothetical protein COU78_05755 [Candidatus Peregrinibacteria bacterium CG10_big_fil_rev_8_21_14_0_10_49_24]PJA67051.1 MAG: hypothetical protein CO157_06350 [Candidatus Peregrinibacteria bacterium CG_4_9_14_3_um_filter_49_12]
MAPKFTIRFEGQDDQSLIAEFDAAAGELVPKAAEYEELWALLEEAGFVVPRRENNLPAVLYKPVGPSMVWVLDWAGFSLEELAGANPADVHEIIRKQLTDLNAYKDWKLSLAKQALQELNVREIILQAQDALAAQLQDVGELPPIVANPTIVQWKQVDDPRANKITLVCMQKLVSVHMSFHAVLDTGK